MTEEKYPTPMQVYAEALKVLGKDWLLWEPETVRIECGRTKSSILKRKNVVECLLAISTIKNTVLPWWDEEVFESTIEALNFVKPDFTILDGLDIDELYFGIEYMLAFREGDKPTWDQRIKGYCAAIHLDWDIYKADGNLAFCNKDLEEYYGGKLYREVEKAEKGKPCEQWAQEAYRKRDMLIKAVKLVRASDPPLPSLAG